MSVLLQTLYPLPGGTRFYEYLVNGVWTLASHTITNAAGMQDGDDGTYEATVVGFDSAHYTYNYAQGRFGDTDDFIGYAMTPFTAQGAIDFVRFKARIKWDGQGGFPNAACFAWPAMDLLGQGSDSGTWDDLRAGWGLLNGQLLGYVNTPGCVPLIDMPSDVTMTTSWRWMTVDMPYCPTYEDRLAIYDPTIVDYVPWTAALLQNRSMGIHIGPIGIGQLANTCAVSEYYYEVWGTHQPTRRRGGIVGLRT